MTSPPPPALRPRVPRLAPAPLALALLAAAVGCAGADLRPVFPTGARVPVTETEVVATTGPEDAPYRTTTTTWMELAFAQGGRVGVDPLRWTTTVTRIRHEERRGDDVTWFDSADGPSDREDDRIWAVLVGVSWEASLRPDGTAEAAFPGRTAWQARMVEAGLEEFARALYDGAFSDEALRAQAAALPELFADRAAAPGDSWDAAATGRSTFLGATRSEWRWTFTAREGDVAVLDRALTSALPPNDLVSDAACTGAQRFDLAARLPIDDRVHCTARQADRTIEVTRTIRWGADPDR